MIITPSYNNEDWVEYNVASILNQTYTNYSVLYIDDNSTDNTYNEVVQITKNFPNWKVIKNKINKGAAYNYIEPIRHLFLDNDIILIHLDGDDWFYDENVLENLNNFYNRTDCWMTYGGFVCWDGEGNVTIPNPQSTPHSKFMHDHKFYRRDQWRASHLRTYRHFLWKQINREDLKSKIDNEYYWHAIDLAWQYPAMEMCGEEKIGVVDFYTCVYNQSKSNAIRTRVRESQDNSKYEIEIRNKKTYAQGLEGIKLPQVNVFPMTYYPELYDIPTKFTYCYEQVSGEFDMVLIIDAGIKEYVEGKYPIQTNKPIVARLLEHKGYFKNEYYDLILSNYEKFDVVLTFDKDLLEKLPNAKFTPPLFVTHFNCLPNPLGIPPSKSDLIDTYELPDNAFQIYEKSKLVSAISSNKAFLPGHVKRLEFIESIKNKVDLFGRGMGKELPSKLDGLRDYMFSVAIENVENDDYYFTEKLTECFLTGTIPIYHGCLNINKFFDMRGILYFNNKEELHEIIDNLSPEKYYSMLEYVKINFETCYKWPLNNDMFYEMYYKDIIKKQK